MVTTTDTKKLRFVDLLEGIRKTWLGAIQVDKAQAN